MKLDDARWFAADLHVPDRRFGILHFDDELIDRASFLDTRVPANLAEAQPLLAADVPARLPRASIAWLFHTSFCASTLLARALHVPPHQVALKEPLVLRRLSDARKSGWAIHGLVEPAVALLGRPWHPGGAVVIKPTHVALNVAPDLLAAAPDSKAIVLTSELDDFLISNLKKPPDSQQKIPTLVERALRTTRLLTRLPPAALAPPDLICAAGLQWAAQREHVRELAQELGARLRVVDSRDLLRDIPATVADVAAWLGLPAPRDALLASAEREARRNAKELTAPYGPEQRAREAGEVAGHFRAELAAARRWLDAHVLPAMSEK